MKTPGRMSRKRKGKAIQAVQPSVTGLIPGAELNSTSLTILSGVTREECIKNIAPMLKVIHNSVRWWWGDFLLHMETKKWGEMYEYAEIASEYSYESLRKAKAVCVQIEPQRRIATLSFEHHREVASAFQDDLAKQDYWLKWADREKTSVKDLRKQIRESKADPIHTKSERPEDAMLEQEYCLNLVAWIEKQKNISEWPSERKALWLQDLKPIGDFIRELKKSPK